MEMKMTRTKVLIASLLICGTAGAKGPAKALPDALTQIATAKTPCTDLRADWKATDAFGVTIAVSIHSGQVTVTRTRIGLGDEIKTSALKPSECRALATTALKTEAWTISVPECRGFERESRPYLRLGVEGKAAMTRYLPERLAPAMAPLAALRDQLQAIGQRTLEPPRTADTSTPTPTEVDPFEAL